MARSGIARSLGTLIFSFIRNLHTVFCRGCSSLHSHQLCMGVPFSTLSPVFIVCRLFNEHHSEWVRWYLTVVLICISLIISSVEHFYLCLLTHSMSSLEKCLDISYIFQLGCLFVTEMYMSCLCILDIKPLSITSFADIFSQSISCLFILFMFSYPVRKLVSLIRSICLFCCCLRRLA